MTNVNIINLFISRALVILFLKTILMMRAQDNFEKHTHTYSTLYTIPPYFFFVTLVRALPTINLNTRRFARNSDLPHGVCFVLCMCSFVFQVVYKLSQ